MDRIRIVGGHPLQGEVRIGGSKNASLPLMAAALLAESASLLDRIPHLDDIVNMARMLEHLGARVTRLDGGLEVDPTGLNGDAEAPYELVRKMRASIYVLGPLLARFGHARVSLPGGCAIGARPVDLHLRGMEALGADIRIEHGFVEAAAPAGGLRGADCVISGPNGSSVGATCNVLMAATLAHGRSVLRGAACEPHVNDLAEYLNRMGARIQGIGTGVLEVEGVDALKGAIYQVIPDQIEAATFMAAVAVTRSDIVLRGCRPDHMKSEIDKFLEIGGQVDVLEDRESLRVRCEGPLRPVSIRTAPYPGFPTDAQAQFMAALCLAEGESHVIETIFPDRFLHAAELNRMGADIVVQPGSAVVRGVARLSGASVMASDLRASAALVVAGLAAEGETEVLRVYHLDRGYERLDEKLRALGAEIERMSESPSS
jgi:UDP-N-acetylglucosamine 1-carboxyvinyltransferase